MPSSSCFSPSHSLNEDTVCMADTMSASSHPERCVTDEQVAETAKAAAEQCDITVAMLADPAAAEAVALGPDGIAAGMTAGTLLSDQGTTCSSSRLTM